MTAASLLSTPPRNGLQPVDLARHLGGIASLLELCFGAELDAGGRGFIREMQLLGRAGPAARLLQAVLMGAHMWSGGFVWVAEGRVVGTVSTQRAAGASSAWLVANVAVHPDYRRRGIALALMRATLDLIRRQGGAEALLQVDDDNLGAVTLYRNLDFARVTTQTTWQRAAYLAPPPPLPDEPAAAIRPRRPGEWQQAYALATVARPEGVLWGRALSPGDFRPSVMRTLDQFFSGRRAEHWVVPASGAQPGLAASLSLQPNASDGDRLLLLVHPAERGRLERPLLVRGLRRLGRRPRPASLEYDANDQAASAVLRELGFVPRRTLRWMRCDLT